MYKSQVVSSTLLYGLDTVPLTDSLSNRLDVVQRVMLKRIIGWICYSEDTWEDRGRRMAEKMRKADFNLENFLSQMQQVKKMGSLGSLVGMMPGMSRVEVGEEEEKKMARTEAIILSMTVQERRTPRLLRGSRLKRIANGSGVQVRDVNALIKQFTQMQKMMKMMRGGKGRKMMKAMKSKMGDMPGSGSDLPSNLPGL